MANETARPSGRREHLLGPGQRRVVVHEEPRQASARRHVDVLSHRLKVNLDDVGPPLVEHALEASAEVAAPTIGRPRRQAAQQAQAPPDPAAETTLGAEGHLYEGAAGGDLGVDVLHARAGE